MLPDANHDGYRSTSSLNLRRKSDPRADGSSQERPHASRDLTELDTIQDGTNLPLVAFRPESLGVTGSEAPASVDRGYLIQ